MRDDVFLKILMDLEDFDYKESIHLYLMGEPLTDDKIVERVKITRGIFPENVIFISTNGDYLTEDVLKSLISAGITWIGVSHYDDKNKHLYELSTKYPMLTHQNVGTLRWTFYNRAGHVDVSCISPQKECDWVYEKAYVNYKGDVILCCSDYKYEVVFGNIMKQAFKEIYDSDFYNEYRKKHREGRGKEMPLCANCNRIKSKRAA
jgi:radical SAM protein with 4Fe4S-binding SPASM domain